MRFIGPDYNQADGIILPGLDAIIRPRTMSDAEIMNLINNFPFLAPYFDNNGTNTVIVDPNTQAVTGDKHYKHTETTPSVLWTITHNLNKYPSIVVVDSAKNKVYGRERYLSLNSVEIEFSAPFSGEAFLN